MFSKSTTSVPLKYFSVNSLLTISAFSSIKEMIESVIFSFVPLGISNSIPTLSLATLGKNAVLMIPPPTEPKVKISAPANRLNVKNLYFMAKRNDGLYNLSRIQIIRRSPNSLITRSFANALAKPLFGLLSKGCNAFECAKCAGNIINASTNETTKVKITITETSPKNSPILLSKNRNIENANIVVIIAEIIGGNTSIVPSTAACTGDFPFS